MNTVTKSFWIAASLGLALLVGACQDPRDGGFATGVSFNVTSGEHHVFAQRDRLGNPLVSEVMIRKDCQAGRSEEHTSELQSRLHLVCRLLLEKKKKTINRQISRPQHTAQSAPDNPPEPSQQRTPCPAELARLSVHACSEQRRLPQPPQKRQPH